MIRLREFVEQGLFVACVLVLAVVLGLTAYAAIGRWAGFLP